MPAKDNRPDRWQRSGGNNERRLGGGTHSEHSTTPSALPPMRDQRAAGSAGALCPVCGRALSLPLAILPGSGSRQLAHFRCAHGNEGDGDAA